jgi:tRNA-splicing ligase RtcB
MSKESLIIYGQHDERTIAQMHRAANFGSVVGSVLCADGHLGYAHPIGGVIAYENHISISGVGFDIACGNMAVRLDTKIEDIRDSLSQIADDIQNRISFGVGRKNAIKVDHPVLESHLFEAAGVSHLRALAAEQLGTVGSGNHYVDLLVDGSGFVWIGVHFGSRGLGHKITTRHLEAVNAKDGMEVDPAIVEVNSDIGRSYIAGIELGGLYAYAGREWVVEQVRQIIGGSVLHTVHNHHNFAWQEEHQGRTLWVVRKGATPAFPGQQGFVGGSMCDNAVILEGVASDKSEASLYSTVHGAGRLVSRSDAKGVRAKTGEWKRPPRFEQEEWQHWLNNSGVVLRGAGLDESPMCYRRLPDVLAEHEGTIRIIEELRPVVVVMAGEKEHDPYKD